MEKDPAVENVRRSSASSSDGGQRSQVPKDPKWQPGFWARFPWIGFGALIMVLVCAVASIIVLVTSNHQSVTNWPKDVAPNVLLNIMASVANICFVIAIGNGIAIAWWRKSLRGSSIEDLSRSWSFSTSIKEILFSLKYFNIIALAALTAKLTLIDSSLMQRATSTYIAMASPRNVSDVTGFVNLTFPVTGTVTGTKQQPGLMSHWMGDTLKLWSSMGGIYPNQWNDCEGVCFLKVPGIGFAFDCDDEVEESIDNGQKLDTAFKNGQNETANLFDITFDTKYLNGPATVLASDDTTNTGSSYLEMNVTHTRATEGTQDLSCPGVKSSRTCKLWPAVINYPVLIQNTSQARTVSIGAQHPLNLAGDSENLGRFNQSGQQQNGFEVLRPIQILESHNTSTDNINSSLSGIQLAMMMYIQGVATLTWDSSLDGSFVISQMGHSANYMTDPPIDPQSCAFQYTDPLNPYSAPNGLFKLPSIVGKINQIMFGLTTDVSLDNPSNDHNETTRFNAMQYEQTIHYLTHFAYMWGAIAATIVFVLLVCPVYWGFWELGRKVTLNPFEIAHAFRSPVVGGASTAATDEMMQEVGKQQIRYGNIAVGNERGKFGVDEPKNVVPANGKSS